MNLLPPILSPIMIFLLLFVIMLFRLFWWYYHYYGYYSPSFFNWLSTVSAPCSVHTILHAENELIQQAEEMIAKVTLDQYIRREQLRETGIEDDESTNNSLVSGSYASGGVLSTGAILGRDDIDNDNNNNNYNGNNSGDSSYDSNSKLELAYAADIEQLLLQRSNSDPVESNSQLEEEIEDEQ